MQFYPRAIETSFRAWSFSFNMINATLRENNTNRSHPCTPTTAIGRVEGDILLPDPKVSSRHARMVCHSDGWHIEDLGSRNGTFVNGQRITGATRLKAGDTILIGSTELLFEQQREGQQPGNSLRISRLLDGIPRIIGRAPDSSIQIDEAVVSRHHARLCCEHGQVVLTDLNSGNGTFVNGQRITRAVITTGDRIRIGATEYTIHDDALALSSRKGAIRLDVRGLSYVVNARGQMRQLLDNVEFSVKPGEFVAVVGGSGTGKTTLFRVLTGLEAPSLGCVSLNGVDYHAPARQFAGQVGFVPQDDIVHNSLTVRSALGYAARLRLPADTTISECDRRVMSVLEAVKLTHRLDTEIKLLSGGERKRVNVALELLTEPNLLLLDEPTSGLDPHRERQMMELMRQLAGEGRTILLTTHSTLSLELCDLLLIMGDGGHLVYFGPPHQALTHFKVSAYEEIYARLGETPQEIIGWQHAYWRSPIYQQYGGIRGGREQAGLHPSLRYARVSFDPAVWFRQFFVLSQRYLAVLLKDHLNMGILLAQAPVLVVIMLLVFPLNSFEAVMTSETTTPLKYANSITFLLAIIAIWFGASNSVREIVKEAPITTRERLAFLRPSAYLCSKFIVLAGLCLIQCIILVVGVGAGMCWFHIGSDALWALFGVMFLTSLAGLSLGLTLSSMARSSDQAVSLTPLLLLPQIIFSGLLIPENAGGLVELLSKLHIAYWSYGALGCIFDLNGKIHELPLPLLKENNLFTGEVEPKVTALILLLAILSAIALGAVHLKRKR